MILTGSSFAGYNVLLAARRLHFSVLGVLRVMNENPFQVAGDEIAHDTVFDLLSHAYRRALLDCLEQHGPSLAVADAAEEVATRNSSCSIEDVPAEDIERVYLSLYHSHVPKLADEGAVTYDRERGVVTLTALGKRLVSVQNRASNSGS